MKLTRWLAAAAAAACAAATLLTGPATAAPREPAAAAQQAPAGTGEGVAAAAPTAPKHFLGAGYGPWNIAVEAAWNSAYAAAAREGYPASWCRRAAGPAGNEIRPGYYQVLVEILCTPPPPPGNGEIVGVHSGKCVEVRGGSTKDGAPIQLNACSGAANQSWKLYPDKTLRVLGRCMDVQYAKTENGSLVGLNSCHQGLNQKWELLPGGLLRSVHSGRCLDALGWATKNGARLGIWDCTPHHTNQQWRGAGLTV
ncbi:MULTISPECIES: RICIN domain-containing protein [unclassified Streptomyces]|uniref:RICIN domain-containing protein n=1 Tax=unclassified Streptomyces TaxID=2593676 RepID=UPI0038260A60